MLQCDKVVTIIHHNKETDSDTYTCTTYGDASWFAKTAIITGAETGAKPSNTYEVRLMTSEGITVSFGDYVALGIVLDIQKPADLKSVDHFRVTAVGDNRRGKLPHWRLSGQ